MPITPTYPGVYIEELPSIARTITPAPTSITVFVGYTHPYKTRRFNEAVQIFSYADYEREFGGIYQSGAIDVNVAYAVNDFFLNGGSNAYVVGLPAVYRDAGGAVITTDPAGDPLIASFGGADVVVPGRNVVNNIAFTAREPTDLVPIRVDIVRKDPATNVADIVVAQGRRAESYRNVTLDATDAANFIDNRIGTAANPVSELVMVAPDDPLAGYTTFPANPSPPPTSVFVQLGAVTFSGSFAEADFTDVFAQDESLDKLDIFNLMAIPGIASEAIWSAALAFCERKMAFLILDPPPDAVATPQPLSIPPAIEEIMKDESDPRVPKSPNGALYFPYLLSRDPLTGDVTSRPPSGHVAGMYAKSDVRRGVWKAPAGLETTLLNTSGPVPDGRLADMRHGVLNDLGVNVLRAFPGTGSVIFGARTLVTKNDAFQQWRYVPVRRTALFIEQTLYRSLKWVVFEPNDEPLWIAIRTTIDAFMLGLFGQGAFRGRTPSQAFLVQCDSTTTTQADIDNGIVNILVGFFPLKPAEFVIIKLTQIAGQA